MGGGGGGEGGEREEEGVGDRGEGEERGERRNQQVRIMFTNGKSMLIQNTIMSLPFIGEKWQYRLTVKPIGVYCVRIYLYGMRRMLAVVAVVAVPQLT